MILENNRIILDNNSIIENLGVYAVPGLILWHDASQLNIPNGTLISEISEKSGTGFNFIQSDVQRRPLNRTNVINGFGAASLELNTVDFPVGNQGTILGSRTGSQNFFNGRVVEVFWVGRFLTPPSGVSLFYHFRSPVNPVVTIRILPSNRLSLSATDNSGNTLITTLTNTLVSNQWYIFSTLFDFTGTFNRTLTVEGVGSISDSSVNSFTFTSSHNFRLGGSANTNTVQFAEGVIASNTAPLSLDNKNIIINYLKTKYNI